MSFSIISRLADVPAGDVFYMTGERINTYNALLRALWQGDNINTDRDSIRKRQNGASGVNLIGTAQDTTTTSGTILPWTIISSPSGSGTFVFTVWPGQVNQIIPSNLFATGFVLNPFTVTGIGTTTATYANLNLTTSSNAVTAATISFDTAIAPPIPSQNNSPVTTFSFCFGMVVGGSTIYRLIGPANMYFTPAVINEVPLTIPAPNAIPWTNVWGWIPSNQV